MSARCSKCGAPVNDEVAGGFCTACLLEEGLKPVELKDAPITLKYFGDYELLEEIARGGMGVVYKARQRSLDRIVAVKMILSGHLASAAEAQRFRGEARAAAALHHPGIVAIHEVGEHEGLLYFSMDFVAGQNLGQVALAGPLPAPRAAQCVRDIAEAIQYAHERGVLHRDLKPSNVLIDAGGKSHVTDFGLAKRLSDAEHETKDKELTVSGQVLGSPSFMPPEQAAGKHRELTPASDVYSLGALLYQLLTGRPPFVAASIPATLRLVAESDPAAPRLFAPNVPRDLETICLKCLEKKPQDRYGTARELAEELQRFLGHEPIRARPVGVTGRLGRWCQRQPATAAALALLLIVAVGSPSAALRILHERNQARAARQNEESQRVQAETNQKRAQEILLASDQFLLDQAATLSDLDRLAAVFTGLNKAIALNPSNALFWNARGLIHEKSNHLEEAHTDFSKAIDLAKDAKARAPFLLNRSHLLRGLNRFGEAGLDYRRAKSLPLAWSGEVPPDYHLSNQVSIQLGVTNQELGLYLAKPAGDGWHMAGRADALHCRVFSFSAHKTNSTEEVVEYGSLPTNHIVYGYFLIDPTFKFACRENVILEMEYFTGGPGEFGFEFDSQKGAYTHYDRRIPLERSGRWSVGRFPLKDVRFENSQNGKADFRLWSFPSALFVRRVTLIRLPRADLDIPARSPGTPPSHIDLSFFYNGGFATNWHDDAPANNLTNLSTGVQRLVGTDFDVRGVIQVMLNSPRRPAAVRDIPVNQSCRQLHFLHAAIEERSTTNSPLIGRYWVQFEDGHRNEIPLVIGANIGDWWDVFPARDATVAWRGESDWSRATGKKLRLFKFTWKNPHPDLLIRSIDLEATQPKAAPFLVAVTAD